MASKVIQKPGLILFLFLLVGISMQAQNIRSIFGKIPGELSLLTDSIKRQDLMDMYDAGQKAQVVNSLNDTCTLVVFSSDFMQLSTGQSSMEIALLPMVNDSKIICIINTSCAPVCDSRIAFYSTNWKRLDTQIFFSPANASWFIKEDADTSDPAYIEATQFLDISLMRFSIDPDKLILTQTYNTPLYLGSKEKKKVDPYLKKESLIFTWNKIQFK